MPESGFGPAAGLQQQPAGSGVDVVAPGAEQLYVAPFVDRRGDGRAGLEDDEVEAAFGRCEAAARPIGLAPITTTGRSEAVTLMGFLEALQSC